jgi:hypothetical protein
MYLKSKHHRLLLIISTISAILIFIGCAAQKNIWGDPKSGLILQYRLTENQVNKYKILNNINQNLDVMGQSINTKVNTKIVFQMNPLGVEKNELNYRVNLDSVNMKMGSPMGEMSPDMTSIVGAGFDMTLSPSGKELDLSGADELKYSMGEGGERSISSEFKTLFPDLPGKPVKIGDSWTTFDTLQVKDNNTDMKLYFENLNTLQGFETVNGIECIKVVAAVKGSMGGTGYQNGADLKFSGEIKASDTWFFAYKKGILVKTVSEGTINSNIAVSGPQEMNIPMKMQTKLNVDLL